MTKPVTIDLSGGRKLTVEAVLDDQAHVVSGRVRLIVDSPYPEPPFVYEDVDLAELYAALRVATGKDTTPWLPDELGHVSDEALDNDRRFLAEQYPDA